MINFIAKATFFALQAQVIIGSWLPFSINTLAEPLTASHGSKHGVNENINVNDEKLNETLIREGLISKDRIIQSAPSYRLFTIPTFKVELTFSSSFDHHVKASDTLPLLASVGHDLDEATTGYLFSYIKGVLQQGQSGDLNENVPAVSASILHSIALDVAVHEISRTSTSSGKNENDPYPNRFRSLRYIDGNVGSNRFMRKLLSSQLQIRAEIAGYATFRHNPYFAENYNASSTNQEIIEVDQNMVRNMISAAFLGSAAMSEYLDQVQTILHSVEKVFVTTNLDLEEENGFEKNEGTLNSSKKDKSSDEFDFAASAAIFGMGFAIVILMGGFYVYFSKEYHKRHLKDGINLLQDTDKDTTTNYMKKYDEFDHDIDNLCLDKTFSGDDSFDSEDGRVLPTSPGSNYNSNRMKTKRSPKNSMQTPTPITIMEMVSASSNPKFNGSNGNHDIIPVPGRNVATSSNLRAVPARQYVKPASPFDVLYGAAFLHHDQERVQKSKYSKTSNNLKGEHSMAHAQKRSKRGASSKQKSPRGKAMRPMMPIEEESFVPKHSYDSRAKNGYNEMKNSYNEENGSNPSFFPQLVSSISTFLSEKRLASSGKHMPVYTDGESIDDNPEWGAKDEEMIVYRDFPRHDGTPCVMFTPKDELEWGLDGSTSQQSGENGTPHKGPPQAAFQNMNRIDQDENLSFTSPRSQSSMGSSLKAGIDTFVDKLEKLIAARSRQYQERVKMDKERVERRKIREEKRRRKKEEKKMQLQTHGTVQEQAESKVEVNVKDSVSSEYLQDSIISVDETSMHSIKGAAPNDDCAYLTSKDLVLKNENPINSEEIAIENSFEINELGNSINNNVKEAVISQPDPSSENVDNSSTIIEAQSRTLDLNKNKPSTGIIKNSEGSEENLKLNMTSEATCGNIESADLPLKLEHKNPQFERSEEEAKGTLEVTQQCISLPKKENDEGDSHPEDEDKDALDTTVTSHAEICKSSSLDRTQTLSASNYHETKTIHLKQNETTNLSKNEVGCTSGLHSFPPSTTEAFEGDIPLQTNTTAQNQPPSTTEYSDGDIPLQTNTTANNQSPSSTETFDCDIPLQISTTAQN